MNCPKCGKSDFERVYKTPRERFVHFWLPGKAYNCNHCGRHMYKHVFPFLSWPLIFGSLVVLGTIIVI